MSNEQQVTFEKFLNAVARQINAETNKQDKVSERRFDQGYALGKLVGRMVNDMTPEEHSEFMRGYATGQEIADVLVNKRLN